MDYSQYETYPFDSVSAINMSTGFKRHNYPRHWHSYGEILLVGPGDTNIYMVNQRTYSLNEGDFVLIWPMEMHEIIDADMKDVLVIQFSNSFVNSLYDLQRIMHFYRNLHTICVSSQPEFTGKLHMIATKMKEVFFAKRHDYELKCCMLLMEFMQELDEHRNEFIPELSEDPRPVYSEDIWRRMILVTDYIKKNLTADDLSQGAMADMAGISKDYFSRIFKNITGMNYNKWINTIRLEKATEFLSDKKMTLTEIAMLSGFQSIPSFNRVFREEKGMAPGEYRALFTKESK